MPYNNNDYEVGDQHQVVVEWWSSGGRVYPVIRNEEYLKREKRN